jgi:hypothetical protein
MSGTTSRAKASRSRETISVSLDSSSGEDQGLLRRRSELDLGIMNDRHRGSPGAGQLRDDVAPQELEICCVGGTELYYRQ